MKTTKPLCIVLALALAVLLVVACGSSTPSASPLDPGSQRAGEAASVSSGPPPTEAASRAASEPRGAGSGRDVTGINVCELLTDQEVASLAQGSVLRAATRADNGELQACTYSLTTAGTDAVELYIVYLQPAAWLEVVLDADEEKGDPVENLGDVAYMKHEVDLDQYRLLVMRTGDVGLEFLGPRAEVLAEMAKLLLSRL